MHYSRNYCHKKNKDILKASKGTFPNKYFFFSIYLKNIVTSLELIQRPFFLVGRIKKITHSIKKAHINNLHSWSFGLKSKKELNPIKITRCRNTWLLHA